jgi:hypothetical protein
LMNTRRITLAIAILSTLATALLAVKDVLPPQWALLVGALGSGAYALVRSAQKLAAGATLKGLLSTSETWGAMLVLAAAIVSAVAGVVKPEHAGGAVAFAGILLKAARMLQAGGLGGQPPMAPQG